MSPYAGTGQAPGPRPLAAAEQTAIRDAVCHFRCAFR